MIGASKLRAMAHFNHTTNAYWNTEGSKLHLSGVCQVSFVAYRLTIPDPFRGSIMGSSRRKRTYRVATGTRQVATGRMRGRREAIDWTAPVCDGAERSLFEAMAEPTGTMTELRVKDLRRAVSGYVALGVERIEVKNYAGKGVVLCGAVGDYGAVLQKYIFPGAEPTAEDLVAGATKNQYLLLGILNALKAGQRSSVVRLDILAQVLVMRFESKKKQDVLETMHCPLNDE